ncbi:CMRF35-like molecule 3 [Puntigrus tetrazona]|uniref:CMRF35-like molecule 3 n=1 Tax=Puntigrus tetrazona TaxID=1606681 RepID=UPI001C8A8117|nr:CMRF35-like molecule 3 [Puntigrus tetrazona]
MIQICEDILLKLHLLLLLTSVCETSEILTFTAHERGTAEIRCPYESGHEELQKYLCRGECLRVNKDKAVESESEAKGKRFSLIDNKTDRIFTVNITDLRTEDQGKYWCGVTTGFGKSDYYREIHLEIKLDFSAIIILSEGIILGITLVSGFLCFIFFTCRRKKEAVRLRGDALVLAENLSTEEATRIVCHYEEIICTDNPSGCSLAVPALDELETLTSSTIIFQSINYSDRTSDGPETSYSATNRL